MVIIVTPKAQKHFESLLSSQQVKVKVKRKLVLLEKYPYMGKKLEGDLSELRSLGAWPYRILYYINSKTNTVYIAAIIHRQGAYK